MSEQFFTSLNNDIKVKMNAVVVLTALSMAVALLTGVAEAQTPDCNVLRNDLARRRIRIFENGGEGIPNVVSEVCVDFQAFR